MSGKHLLTILIFSAAILTPLLSSGFYTSPDGENHLVRLAYFHRQLTRGQVFPGWIEDLNRGQGYPIFYFTYPTPYYISSFWKFLGFSTVDSLKLTLALSTIVSLLFGYLWWTKLSQNRSIALFATLLFALTPYRFLNLYVRAALGEVVFLSMVTLSFWALESKRYKLLAVGIALMITSHLQLSTIFIPLLGIYVLLKKFSPVKTLKYLILGIILAGFFWIPSVGLLSKTKFLQTQQFVPAEHLPTFSQLVYSPWGFGFSHPGPQDELSYQLGITQWIILGASTVFAFLTTNWPALGVGLTSWITLLLISHNPLNLWNQAWLYSIQFPWRMLIVPMVAIPTFIVFTYKKGSKWLICPLILLALYSNRNHIRTNLPQFADTPDRYFFLQTTTTATPDEFMPKDVYSRNDFENSAYLPISRVITLTGILYLLARDKN